MTDTKLLGLGCNSRPYILDSAHFAWLDLSPDIFGQSGTGVRSIAMYHFVWLLSCLHDEREPVSSRADCLVILQQHTKFEYTGATSRAHNTWLGMHIFFTCTYGWVCYVPTTKYYIHTRITHDIFWVLRYTRYILCTLYSVWHSLRATISTGSRHRTAVNKYTLSRRLINQSPFNSTTMHDNTHYTNDSRSTSDGELNA